MKIFKATDRPTTAPNPDYFHGDVLQTPIVTAPEPARLRALLVQFAPGARTAWHTHPLGQTLYVTQGVGYVALRGQAPQQIRAGDTVWIPPHIEHWHGAAPDHAMAHVAMQEAQNGQVADWLEHVSDADYPSPTAKA